MNEYKIASETAKRWLTNPTEAPLSATMPEQGGENQQVAATYSTSFADYHQVMSSKDDAGFTWIEKLKTNPNAPDDVAWLSSARQKYSSSYTDYLNGSISYEKFVLDNFEEDVWRRQGFDFKNPTFWYKRYMQNDFSDPRANLGLRFDVLTEAMKYSQYMEFEDLLFSPQSQTNTILRDLDGKIKDVAGKPVTEQTMESLLGDEWLTIKNKFNGDVDRALLYARSTGAELQRLFYNDQNGEPSWYIHTDGKVYKVKEFDGKRQDGYASYKGPADAPTEIWIDSNNAFNLGWAAGDAFASSFGGFIFTLASTFASIPALAVDLAEGVVTNDFTFDKVASTALFFNDIQESMALTARSRIDLDGFQYGSMADWGDAIGGFVGTMAGMIATAKFGGFLQQSNVAPIKYVGGILNKATNIYSGGGVSKAAGAQTASMATHTFMQALGARTTFAVTFGLKDGFNVLTNRTLVNDDRAFQKAVLTTAVNSAITLALGSTKADDTAYMYKRMWMKTQGLVTDPGIIASATGLLTRRSMITAGLDVFDNYFTMSIAESMANRGVMQIDWSPQRAIYSTLMAGNAYRGSQKAGQFISNKTPTIFFREFDLDLNKRIDAATGQDKLDLQQLQAVIRKDITAAQATATKQDLSTGRWAWDIMTEISRKVDAPDSIIPDSQPVKSMIQKIHDAEGHAFHKEMFAEGEKLYEELQVAEQGFVERVIKYGFRNTDGTGRGAFEKDFTKRVYESIAAQTKIDMERLGDLSSVDKVAQLIYDLYGDNVEVDQEGLLELFKYATTERINGQYVINVNGRGSTAQADPAFGRLEKVLEFAKKYGVLIQNDNNDKDNYIIASAFMKDLDDDGNLKSQIVEKQKLANMEGAELTELSIKNTLDSIMRYRNTVGVILRIARSESIELKDITQLKEVMGRRNASTEEILQDLTLQGFVKPDVLLQLIRKLPKSEIPRTSYLRKALMIDELIQQGTEIPAKQEENLRKINGIIKTASSVDDQLAKFLDDMYGKDFTKDYQKALGDLFSQRASDIEGEIKKSYLEASQEFLEEPVKFSFFKEDGSIKNLSEAAAELKLERDTDLYKALQAKGETYTKKDLLDVYKIISDNADELPRNVILQVGAERVASVFRDNVSYSTERRVNVNLATILTKTEVEIIEIKVANSILDDRQILNIIAGRRDNISIGELKRQIASETEGLNLLRRNNPETNIIEVSDIQGTLGRLGYDDSIFEKSYPGILALDQGEVLVEIGGGTYQSATIRQEAYSIPGTTNKQSELLRTYGPTRQINESTRIASGELRQFLGEILTDVNQTRLVGETFDSIKSKAKAQTFGGLGGLEVNRAFTTVGRSIPDQTSIMKTVFLKNLIKEMTEGESSKVIETYVTASKSELKEYEKYWTVTEEDGRYKLTGFKGVDDTVALESKDIKYIIPLELRTEDVITFRSKSNDASYHMKFLPEYMYGTYDESMIQLSSGDNLSINKLITSYLQFADAQQKKLVTDLLLRPITNEATGESISPLYDVSIPLGRIGLDSEGRIIQPTITERNVIALSKLQEADIQNDADRMLVELAKHFVSLSKETVSDEERLATDTLFRKVLEEDLSNNAEEIATKYLSALEEIKTEAPFEITDTDFEREAGAFPKVILENEFSDLVGTIRNILTGLETQEMSTRTIYDQSSIDAYLETNIIDMDGKLYLPVKSLLNAPDGVLDKITGGEIAREKIETLKDLVGDRRSVEVKLDMVNRDFPSLRQNKSMFVYNETDDSLIERVYLNARRSEAIRAMNNADFDETKRKTPLGVDKQYVDVIDKNDFYNNTISRMKLNPNQKKSLSTVFDEFNGTDRPGFIILTKDGQIIKTNSTGYNQYKDYDNDSLIFQYLTNRANDPAFFDDAIIFTADNFRKNFYTNPNITSTKLDGKILTMLESDIKQSFTDFLTKSENNLDLMDIEKVKKDAKLLEKFSRVEAQWLAQRASRETSVRYWIDQQADIGPDNLKNEMFRIINETVYGRDKTVDNLAKLFFDQKINMNDRSIKSVMGFLTDGIAADRETLETAQRVYTSVYEDMRSRFAEGIINEKAFDIAFDSIDKKVRTLLSEINTQTLTQRKVPTASLLNVNSIKNSMMKELKEGVESAFNFEVAPDSFKNKKEIDASLRLFKANKDKEVGDWLKENLQNLITLSALKNTTDGSAKNNSLNTNALRVLTRNGYNLTNSKNDLEQGVQLKSASNDELFREFSQANKLYIDTEFYTFKGQKKLLSIGFSSDDGFEKAFYFKTVGGKTDQDRRSNFDDHLKNSGLPADVVKGLRKDFESSLKNPGDTFDSPEKARRVIQDIVNAYSIKNKGMVLAHEGRNVEFKDLQDILGVKWDGIRLLDTVEFANMYRLLKPESTLSNSLDFLKTSYYDSKVGVDVDRHTALEDARVTKEIMQKIADDYKGYEQNKYDGGRFYSDLNQLFDRFEQNKDITFDRTKAAETLETEIALVKENAERQGLITRDVGPIATQKTFVQLNNLIRQLSADRSSGNISRAYDISLEKFNLSPVSQATRTALNQLDITGRENLKSIFNYLVDNPGVLNKLKTDLRYPYEIKANKFLNADQILERLTLNDFALEKLKISKEQLEKYSGDISERFLNAAQFKELQSKLEKSNPLQTVYERGFDSIFKNMPIENIDELRNLIMNPVFDLFAKDLAQGKTFTQEGTTGILPTPKNKKFIQQVKQFIEDYSLASLNRIDFTREGGIGSNQGPYQNLIVHRSSYNMGTKKPFTNFKASDAFISESMLNEKMLANIDVNQRNNYILKDNNGRYVWTKLYINPNDNPGKFVAVKTYIHKDNDSNNVEFDPTFLKMLARDNDGDKIGFVPVSKNSKELIEGYEFATRAQYSSLDKLKQTVNELKPLVEVTRQQTSKENNVVFQYLKGVDERIDFTDLKSIEEFYKNAELSKELFDWHKELLDFDPERTKAKDVSLLAKVTKDIQLGGEQNKQSIARFKEEFLKQLPSVENQLEDSDLLAKSVQLPIILDDDTKEILLTAELMLSEKSGAYREIAQIKKDLGLKASEHLFNLVGKYNNETIDFARNAENNSEYQRLIGEAVNARGDLYRSELSRLNEIYFKFLVNNEQAFISKGGGAEQKANDLDRFYNEVEKLSTEQIIDDPESPLAFISRRVPVFVSSKVPADARLINKNYSHQERIGSIKDEYILNERNTVLIKGELKTNIPVSKGQALYVEDGNTIASNVDGYARLFAENNEVKGIIVYESKEIGTETKTTTVDSSVGKTIGQRFGEVTREDGSIDDQIAQFISDNTFKTKKISDLETVQGMKVLDQNAVRIIDGERYEGFIVELDTAIIEDTRTWANTNLRQLDISGLYQNLESVFGRIEFSGNDVKQFIDLMDNVEEIKSYQGADMTDSVWTMSVFAPLKLLNDSQRAEFFKTYNDKNKINMSKEQFIQMYNTGHMLRENIEDILGRDLNTVTRDEVEKILQKETKNYDPKNRDDKIFTDLIWKSINGDLIELENNYETLYTGIGDPDSTISKQVRESEAAEEYAAIYNTPLKESARTQLVGGKQVKMPDYRPILTTDVAKEIGSYLDYDRYLYMMENKIHTPQDAYTDISTGFKPINKDSLVYDSKSNAVSEEFYKSFPSSTQFGDLQIRGRSPMTMEEFMNMQINKPAYNGSVKGVELPGEKPTLNDKLKFLLEATYKALDEKPDNLGMVTRMKSTELLPAEGQTIKQDTALDRGSFDQTYINGYGFIRGEDGKIRFDSVPNVLQFRNKVEEGRFGKPVRGNQNQLREEFFADNVLLGRDYLTADEKEGVLRNAATVVKDAGGFGKPLPVEIPEGFFDKLAETTGVDNLKLNIKELEMDLSNIGLKPQDNEDILTTFLQNKQRPVSGSLLELELKKSLITSMGLKIDSPEAFALERLIAMFNNNSKELYRSLSRNLKAIDGLLASKRQKQEFYRYYNFKYFDVAKEAEMNKEFESSIRKVFGNEKSIEEIRKQYLKDYESNSGNREILREYETMANSLLKIAQETFRVSAFKEPIADPIRLLYPFYGTSDDPTKQFLKQGLINKTVATVDLNKYDPSTMDYDPFKSLSVYAQKISKKLALEKLATNGKKLGVTDNVKVINLAREFADTRILNNPKYTKDVIKSFSFIESELVSRFGSMYTRYNQLYKQYSSGVKIDDGERIKAKLNTIETLIDETLVKTQDMITNSEFSKGASMIEKNYEMIEQLESELRNPLFSRLVNPLKESLLLRDQMYGTLASIKTDEKFIDFAKQRLPNLRITDGYLRSLESDFFVKPTDSMSLEYLRTSLSNINRPLFLRALEGDVYATNKNFADHLNKYFYTAKPSNKAVQWMSRYSNIAVKFIMGNPLKLMERLEFFTVTDMFMLTNANPFAVSKLARSRKELTGYQFARPSEAEARGDLTQVQKFLQLIGNDAGSARNADFYTRNQEIEPLKLDNKMTDTTLDFIEIQNNLSRYALYLQTLEDLEKYKTVKYYGNAYTNKEGIDKMSSNEEKAWAVTSSNIPLFGDLPFALRYTSPWLVFASFPMAQARHVGEWVKSYHKVMKDDVIHNDPKEFMRNAAMPAGVLGLEMLLGQMIIGAIANQFDVDEETEERWKKDDSFISLFQTLFFDKPTVRQKSANPYRIVYDTLIGTGQRAATDRISGELKDDWISAIPMGYFNSEVLGRLNPTLKIPLEVITEKDFFGVDTRSAPYDLNYMQNMLRKVGGYVIGSASTRALVDSMQLHKYQPEEQSLLLSMVQGIGNGVADEFGNSKTYKRDLRDFYGARSIIYGHLYATEKTSTVNSVKNFNEVIQSEYGFSSNTNYNADHVDEVSELLRAAMFREEDVSVVYNVLLDKIDDGYAPSSLTAAINRVSVSRLIERIKDPDQFWTSLTDKERTQIENGLAYERKIFPALDEIELYGRSTNFQNASSGDATRTRPFDQRGSFRPYTFIPFNQHRFMPYSSDYFNWYRPQKSRVNIFQNMGTYNPRYAANSAYERWNKK